MTAPLPLPMTTRLPQRSVFRGGAMDGRRAWLATILFLSAVLAIELWPAARPPVVASQPSARPARAVIPPGAKGSTGPNARTVLARPLFSVHRRPAVDPRQPSLVAGAALPRLSGIVITATARRAIFAGDGRPRSGSVGDRIDGYTIVAIGPQAVTVAGPAGTHVLSLSFDANRVASPFANPHPSILDQLNSQRFRPPLLPTPGMLRNLLVHQPAAQH